MYFYDMREDSEGSKDWRRTALPRSPMWCVPGRGEASKPCSCQKVLSLSGFVYDRKHPAQWPCEVTLFPVVTYTPGITESAIVR